MKRKPIPSPDLPLYPTHTAEPFRLTAETTPDYDRLAAEQAQIERDRATAAARQRLIPMPQ